VSSGRRRDGCLRRCAQGANPKSFSLRIEGVVGPRLQMLRGGLRLCALLLGGVGLPGIVLVGDGSAAGALGA
jgi:hypothetical protein